MKSFLRSIFLTSLLFAPGLLLAYNPTINETTLPSEVMTIDSNIEIQSEYLGELTGYPQMYEFIVASGAVLNLELTQLPAERVTPFSLIAVKENANNGGVSEIGRLQAKDIDWVLIEDKVLGMELLQSQTFSAELGAGMYRVEVSTPDNFGSYLLTVGEISFNPGYFSTFSDIRAIQKFFGLGFFSLFKSSHVSYPLGILVLLILFFVTWRQREYLRSRFSIAK